MKYNNYFYIDSNTKNYYLDNNIEHFDIQYLEGPKIEHFDMQYLEGPKIEHFDMQYLEGPEGNIGNRGYQGARGLQGLQGRRGTRGKFGVKGDPGTRGYRGISGYPGSKGDKGADGVQGVTGLQGFIGPQGDYGPRGGPGPVGPPGKPGLDGLQGYTGIKGGIGDKGDGGVKVPSLPIPEKTDKCDIGPCKDLGQFCYRDGGRICMNVANPDEGCETPPCWNRISALKDDDKKNLICGSEPCPQWQKTKGFVCGSAPNPKKMTAMERNMSLEELANQECADDGCKAVIVLQGREPGTEHIRKWTTTNKCDNMDFPDSKWVLKEKNYWEPIIMIKKPEGNDGVNYNFATKFTVDGVSWDRPHGFTVKGQVENPTDSKFTTSYKYKFNKYKNIVCPPNSYISAFGYTRHGSKTTGPQAWCPNNGGSSRTGYCWTGFNRHGGKQPHDDWNQQRPGMPYNYKVECTKIL